METNFAIPFKQQPFTEAHIKPTSTWEDWGGGQIAASYEPHILQKSKQELAITRPRHQQHTKSDEPSLKKAFSAETLHKQSANFAARKVECLL